jgi:hypothetical protein
MWTAYGTATLASRFISSAATSLTSIGPVQTRTLRDTNPFREARLGNRRNRRTTNPSVGSSTTANDGRVPDVQAVVQRLSTSRHAINIGRRFRIRTFGPSATVAS